MKTENQGLIVIEKQYNEENIYLICEESWFEKMPLSETYAGYGQKVDAGEAGDYLNLLSSQAVDEANGEDNEEEHKTYSIGDTIAAYDNGATYKMLVENKLLKDGVDYELTQSEVLGYTFWDGHNFKTVTIETDDYEPTYKRADEELEDKILKEYFEFDDYSSFGAGCQRAKGEEFVFYKSQWQGEFQLAKVEYYFEEQY